MEDSGLAGLNWPPCPYVDPPLVLNAHFINCSGLKRLSKSILANAVRYVRSSPQRLEFLKTCVDSKGLSIKGMVCMDVPTRFKLRHVTHLFRKEKFDEAEVENKTKEIKEVLMSMCEEYAPRLDGRIHMRSENGDDISTTLEDEPTPEEYEFYKC
ncbi:hypothetical protein L3X38_010897 [Prunus dulcis]|uniref:Uncharacterized protein n=1 Tax=Prunus dulcis TaxID=3755 RepID=A0AAD4WIU9_PRUDU|nr:hypothetical protein L3X38_010897 [Prunus dulcis]